MLRVTRVTDPCVPWSLIRDFVPRYAREGVDPDDALAWAYAAARVYMQTEPFWRSVWSSDIVDDARPTWTDASPAFGGQAAST
jgi:hypothetical protein